MNLLLSRNPIYYEQEIIVTCSCGAIIPHENIDHWNGCNEEGEEYGWSYGIFQWGEWESRDEALRHIKNYLKEIAWNLN